MDLTRYDKEVTLNRDQAEYLETLGYLPTAWRGRGEPSIQTCELWIVSPHFNTGTDPFANAAGQLLARMCDAMGVNRQDIHASSVAANASSEELAEISRGVRTRALVAFGVPAAESLRSESLPVAVTHPLSDVLTQPELKKPVWDELQQVMGWLGLRR